MHCRAVAAVTRFIVAFKNIGFAPLSDAPLAAPPPARMRPRARRACVVGAVEFDAKHKRRIRCQTQTSNLIPNKVQATLSRTGRTIHAVHVVRDGDPHDPVELAPQQGARLGGGGGPRQRFTPAPRFAVGAADGRCRWALPMGAADGRCRWALPMGAADGRCRWALLMGAADGRCRWALLMGAADGRC